MEFSYEIGDRVRIWTLKGFPSGTVENIVTFKDKPSEFLIKYGPDEDINIHSFAAHELALVSKGRSKYERICECGSTTSKHSHWCPKD